MTNSIAGAIVILQIPKMEVEVNIMSNVAFPVLTGEIAKRGIKKCAISAALGISGRALYNKMSGKVPFTWPEVCNINERFFPDMSKDDLFTPAEQARNGA